MKFVLGTILILGYFGNSVLVGAMYPELSTDYYQFIEAYDLRRKIYEVMFCLFFYTCMVGEKGITRAVFAFGFVICAASCIDKVFLNISHYLVTDLLVVLVALGAAYYAYIKTKDVKLAK